MHRHGFHRRSSLLPKIEHGDTENLVKIPGDLLVDKDLTVENEATFNTVNVKKNINTDKITQNGKAVPAITLVTLDNPTRYQLQIELDASQNY